MDRLKDAARKGLSDQLRITNKQPPTLLDTWSIEYAQLQEIVRSRPDFSRLSAESTFIVENSIYYVDNLARLAIIAYKHGHIQLGDEFYPTILDVGTSEPYLTRRVMYELHRAQVRAILSPYKVSTSRQIRARHHQTLYDPRAPDAVKSNIWSSKYRVPPEVIERFKREAMLTGIYILVLIKLNVEYPPGLEADVDDTIELYNIMSGQPHQVDTKHLEALIWDLALVLALKRGYYEIVNKLQKERLRNLKERLEPWNKPKYIYGFLKHFTLPEVESFYSGFGSVWPDRRNLLTELLLGNCTTLYFQYTQKYGHEGIDRNSLLGTRSLLIASDIMNRIEPGYSSEVRTWFMRNVSSLAKLWRKCGRDQYEDALIYIASKFDIVADGESLLAGALDVGVVSLLRYIMSPGLIRAPIKDLQAILPTNFPHGESHGMYDVLLVALEIVRNG